MKKHWATLLQIGEIEVDDMCATHVHISPLEEKVWSLRQLKQVAKAVIYFEEAFKVISAPSRRHHDFTETYKGIHDPQEFPQFAEYRQSIQRCTNNLQLIDVMQPNGRDYPWNFENTDVKFASRDAKSIETIGEVLAPNNDECYADTFQSSAAPLALRRPHIVSSGWNSQYPLSKQPRSMILKTFASTISQTLKALRTSCSKQESQI